MIQSTVRRYPLIFSTLLEIFGYYLEKTMRLLQLIMHHTELVPPDSEHNLGTVNIRYGCRRGSMSAHSP